MRELIKTAAVTGEIVQQSTTQFGQQFKVDWIVRDIDGIRLRTIWETTANKPYTRLITAFVKLNEQN
ncbi:DUF6883 domain-containing protein [Nostoc sp. NMS8]|uniref:DUF6883 domain-containing protein n=1 Tax=Nostoc sp. NMS8 TaxID=2815392 RepID=UPI0025FE878F|nr:DUF6883 domain-containing protein [Nostoc sp. NMS8]